MKAVEAAGYGDQARPLRLEHLPDGLILELGVLVGFGVSHTTIEEPVIQLVEALHSQSWREEALAYQADLVLDLPLSQPDAGVQAVGSTR